jgi:hypothetical protein
MFEMYQNAYRGLPPAMTPFHFMPMMMSPDARFPAPHTASRPPTEAPPRSAPTGDDPSEVQELRRRVNELERLMARATKKRKPPRARRKTSR